jgi:hypothetical protein
MKVGVGLRLKNNGSSAAKAAIDSGELTARLKPRPFKAACQNHFKMSHYEGGGGVTVPAVRKKTSSCA